MLLIKTPVAVFLREAQLGGSRIRYDIRWSDFTLTRLSTIYISARTIVHIQSSTHRLALHGRKSVESF